MKMHCGKTIYVANSFLKNASLPGLQYRRLIPAPVDRTFASAWLYKHPWMMRQKISKAHQ